MEKKAIFKIQKTDMCGGWLIDHTTDETAPFRWEPFTFSSKRYMAIEALELFHYPTDDELLIKRLSNSIKCDFDEGGKVTICVIDEELIKDVQNECKKLDIHNINSR